MCSLDLDVRGRRIPLLPGEMNGTEWGANLPAGSAVFGGGADMPGGGRMPWTLFFVPVPRWSDGTLAEYHG